jgi:hypothetical protein
MYKNLTFEQFQKDVDDGWVEWCEDHIRRLRRLYLGVQMEHSKVFLEKRIEHFKVLRRMK